MPKLGVNVSRKLANSVTSTVHPLGVEVLTLDISRIIYELPNSVSSEDLIYVIEEYLND